MPRFEPRLKHLESLARPRGEDFALLTWGAFTEDVVACALGRGESRVIVRRRQSEPLGVFKQRVREQAQATNPKGWTFVMPIRADQRDLLA